MKGTILILVGKDYEELELWYPKLRLEEAGFKTVLAGIESRKTYSGKWSYPAHSDISLDSIKAEEYAGVVVPGGWMPDKLRRYPQVKEALQHFHKEKKLIAAICHGGWIPISANVYRGVKVTGSPGIKDDLINAGGEYFDEEVVADGHHISSRRPSDLPAFMKAVLAYLEK